jgi:hypothetical protein
MDEVREGLNMMKYALNHHYMLYSWLVTFLTGFMKFPATLVVEIICLLTVCISLAPMAIVYNFIALGIIADFDSYIFESFFCGMKSLIEQDKDHPLFPICHTTTVWSLPILASRKF